MGDVEEEELEGEAVAGHSGEATAHSSGNTPLVLLISLVTNLYMYIFFNILPLILTSFFFLADESTDEEVSRPKTKEEDDIDMLHSWIQVGGLPAQLEEEALGLLLEVGSLFFLSACCPYGFLFPFIFLPLYFSFLLSFRGWVY